MNNVFILIAVWILSNIWAILSISASVYIIVVMRFVFYWISLYRVMQQKELPAEIPMPLDVKLGLGFAIALACGPMDYALLVTYPNFATFFIVLILNLLIIGGSLGTILMPLRQYKLSVYDLKAQRKQK